MCVHLFVCMCVFIVCVYVCVYLFMCSEFVRVCICSCVQSSCVCVCVCVCACVLWYVLLCIHVGQHGVGNFLVSGLLPQFIFLP